MTGARRNKPAAAAATFDGEGDEYYTPRDPYVKAIERTLGGIELDPASCEKANRVVKADRIFTIADDGLSQDWRARTVYLNPPYTKKVRPSMQARWTAYALDQYRRSMFRSGIICVNFRPSEKWFFPLTRFPIACPDHRIEFENAANADQPRHASAFVYLPDDVSLGLGPRHANATMNVTHLAIQRFVDQFAPFCAMIYLPQAPVLAVYDQAHETNMIEEGALIP